MNPESASSFLKPGTIVNTRVGSNSIWYRNIVYSCQGAEVCLGLTDSYLENIIMPGMKFSIKLTGEYFEYIFEGSVTGIKSYHPARIFIQVGRAQEVINTRAFPRFDAYLSSSLRPLWDSTSHFCITTNISLGGIAFVTKCSYECGDELEVYIFLPGGKLINCNGKIIRKSVRGELVDYNMQFIEMDEENSNILSDYIEYLDESLTKLKARYINDIQPLL